MFWPLVNALLLGGIAAWFGCPAWSSIGLSILAYYITAKSKD